MKTNSPEREALAQAIADHAAVAKELEDATRAALITSRRMWEVAEELSALRNAAEHPESAGDLMVQSILAGDDTAVLGRPIDSARVEELEAAHAKWKRAADECRATQADAERKLSYAVMRRDDAARAVVTAGENIERLFEGIAELHEEVAARRSALSTIARLMTPPTDAAVTARLAKMMDWDVSSHPAAGAWAQAFEALKRDATVELPK